MRIALQEDALQVDLAKLLYASTDDDGVKVPTTN